MALKMLVQSIEAENKPVLITLGLGEGDEGFKLLGVIRIVDTDAMFIGFDVAVVPSPLFAMGLLARISCKVAMEKAFCVELDHEDPDLAALADQIRQALAKVRGVVNG